MELCRADGRPSGLTATTADFYMFLNNAGNVGKLRIIKTEELQTHFLHAKAKTWNTETYGDKIGSRLANLNFKDFNDIMILEMKYDRFNKQFNTNTAKSNSYATRFIHKFLRG